MKVLGEVQSKENNFFGKIKTLGQYSVIVVIGAGIGLSALDSSTSAATANIQSNAVIKIDSPTIVKSVDGDRSHAKLISQSAYYKNKTGGLKNNLSEVDSMNCSESVSGNYSNVIAKKVKVYHKSGSTHATVLVMPSINNKGLDGASASNNDPLMSYLGKKFESVKRINDASVNDRDITRISSRAITRSSFESFGVFQSVNVDKNGVISKENMDKAVHSALSKVARAYDISVKNSVEISPNTKNLQDLMLVASIDRHELNSFVAGIDVNGAKRSTMVARR